MSEFRDQWVEPDGGLYEASSHKRTHPHLKLPGRCEMCGRLGLLITMKLDHCERIHQGETYIEMPFRARFRLCPNHDAMEGIRWMVKRVTSGAPSGGAE